MLFDIWHQNQIKWENEIEDLEGCYGCCDSFDFKGLFRGAHDFKIIGISDAHFVKGNCQDYEECKDYES